MRLGRDQQRRLDHRHQRFERRGQRHGQLLRSGEGGAQRSGTITVNGQAFTITQAPHPSSCGYSLDITSAPASENGGPGAFNLTTGAGCPWTASSNAGWLTITSATSGAGPAPINYSVTANSGQQRVGVITVGGTVGGQPFTVTQAPHPSSCVFALSPGSQSFSAAGGSGSFNVTTGAGCNWDAAISDGWITINGGATGTGNGPVSFTVQTNNGSPRTGSITVREQVFTITQCGYALSPSSQHFVAAGEVSSFDVTSGAGCPWNTTTTNGWITINSGATGTGNGTVSFTVQANNGGSRTGSISVSGRVFTISQCGYAVSPTGAQFDYGGGSGTVTVSEAEGCPWAANSNAWWISVASAGQTIYGNGAVNYSVPVWGETNGYRVGTITVAGKTITISQTGPPGGGDCCTEPPFCYCLTALDPSATDANPRGLTASYFSNMTLSGQPALKRTDAIVNFNWAGKRPDKLLPADRFSVRWNGRLAAPSSEAYTFYLYSDGGARFWVNNQLVIDRWQQPSEPHTRSAPVELKAGATADIRVEYYNAGGKAGIHLLWSSASTRKQIIPQRHLYPEAATNGSTLIDTKQQTGMLLPPGSDAGPKAIGLQPNAPSQWLAVPLGRAGLVLLILIACGILSLLLRTIWRQARRRFAMAAVYSGIVSRLRLHDGIVWLEDVMRLSKQSLSLRFLRFHRAFAVRRLTRLVALLSRSLHFLNVLCASAVRWITRPVAILFARYPRLLPQLKLTIRRALVIAIIVRLAAPLTPAQADGLVRAAQMTWREARAYTSATVNRYATGSGSDLLDRLISMASGRRPGKVISMASQAEQVAELQVCPTHHVMFVGERYTFTPVALDSANKVVHGAGMGWSSLNPAVATVSSFGEVKAVAVGTTTVTVQSGSASKQITIEVRSGTRPTGSNQQADLDPPTDCASEQASMFAPQSAADAPAQQSLIGSDGVLYDWDPDPAPGSLATHFRNAVGNPRFTARSQSSAAVPTSAQLGSYSYQFDVPIVSVGGRGASASIGMTLNSRVWNTDDGKLTFNYVGAYPAPGWTMGYGKIIRNYNATGAGDKSGVGSGNSPGDYLLVEDDGTRTQLVAKYDAAAGRWFHESDGDSFLQFNPISGEMRYPDGTRMIYSSVNGCLLPTAMINSNGGAITLTYRDYCEGESCLRVFRHRTALSAVRDTLGKYVTFHYYGDNDYPSDAAQGRPAGELAAIKAPDTNGVQQEVIRVEYQPIILKYDFGGAVVDAPANNSQIQVVRRIYYPQTGRGFLFLDYSSYGMPRKISSRMGMTGAAGTITDGAEIAYTTYNYTTIDPNDPYGRNQVGSLSDFPQFTRREEWWQGKTDASGALTTAPTMYDYSRTTDASTEVATMKYVDKNCEEVTTTGIDSGQLSFGKVISVERKNSTTGAVLSKEIYTYMTGPDGEVEIEKIETIDEAGQGTLVRFGYGHYGRMSDRYECGYKQAGSYQVRRRTHYDYIDDQSYLAAGFLGLVSRVSLYDAKNNNDDADDELKVKTETTYDDYAAMGGMQSYGLNPSLYPPNHDAAYDQNKVMRGNATAVKTFSRFNPEEATTRRVRFDIFGNVVDAELSCCVVKSFNFSSATAYSQPDSIRSGGATGLNLETTYQYNYFTGLVDNETNPDGQRTDYEYDRALRLKQVTLPTNAVAMTQFEQDGAGNDLLAYISQTIYDDQGTTKVITGKQWFDGSGRVIRAGTGTGDAPNSYDMTATVYDGWGRVVKQSNSYPGDANGHLQAGGAQFWTTNTFDELSQVIRVTLPDNQLIQTTYSGATATSGATVIATDTVGRKRKSEVDGLGRLVKVTEQNPANGNLEWETSYSYDALDNLIQVYQGGQLRTFTYDAKGRLISETLPEAGTITYTYTDFDAVRTRTDARGVVTTYVYGPLNLLTGVSYNTASATGVVATAPVSITHKTASPGKGQIETVTDGAGSESYGYDSFGRLQSRIRVVDEISYETRYEYNAAGQMTLMIYPSGKRVKVERDSRGRPSALQRVDASGAAQESYLSEINYRADGLIGSQRLGSGATESFGYSDDRLQLTSQTVTKGSATLLDLSYGYQAGAGQMGSGSTSGNSSQLVGVNGTINGQGRSQTFTYDNVGRLVTATGWGAWARRYDYDRYGNRTAVWDAVSGGGQLQNALMEQVGGIKTNRIASVNGITFSYDAGGNVAGDGARAFTYDAENRIVSVSGLVSESYSYDAGNHRVKKETGGVVTHYIWEGNQVIAEYERGGAATQATGTRYYHQDRLSTRVVTDGAGAVVGMTDHLPFGEEIGGSGEGEKHKFTTYERDNTGLDYAVNRHYASQRGRFNQVDPLGMGASSLANPQSLNLYSYVHNDPINFVDPSGLQEIVWRYDPNWHPPTDSFNGGFGTNGGGTYGMLLGGGEGQEGGSGGQEDEKPKTKPRAPRGIEKKKGRLSKEECERLFKKIENLTRDLATRIAEFGMDQLNLRIRGNFYERKERDKKTGEIKIKKGGLDTHIEEYYRKKNSLKDTLTKYSKGRCGNRGGGGDGTSEALEAARRVIDEPAIIPDYQTGLKREADSPAIDCCGLGLDCCDDIYAPGFGARVPGRLPVRVPLRVPLRVPVFVP
jgi:RHS repeat-associated protein